MAGPDVDGGPCASHDARWARSGTKLLIGAWALDSVEALICLAIALATAWTAYAAAAAGTAPERLGQLLADVLIGSLPLTMMAVVALSKIPLVIACYHARRWVWRGLFAAALAVMVGVSVETLLNGFERMLWSRIQPVEAHTNQSAGLQATIAQKRTQEAELERQNDDAAEAAAAIQKQRAALQATFERDSAAFQRQGEMPQAEQTAREREQLQASVAALDGQIARLDKEIRNAATARMRRVHQREREKLAAQREDLQRELQTRLTTEREGRQALLERQRREQAELTAAYRAQQQALEAREAALRREVEARGARIATLAAEVDTLEQQRLALASEHEQAAEADQIHRITALVYGLERAADVTREQMRWVAGVWFGSLAWIASAAGPILAFGSLVLRHQHESKASDLVGRAKLWASLRRAIVSLRWRRTRTVVREVVKEVVKEVPVDRVVVREVVREVVRVVRRYVYLPLWTPGRKGTAPEPECDGAASSSRNLTLVTGERSGRQREAE